MKKFIKIVAVIAVGYASFTSAIAQTANTSFVGAVSGPTDKVQVVRSGGDYQATDGAQLVRGDTISVPRGQSVTVKLDGCSGALKGPVKLTLSGPDFCANLSNALNASAGGGFGKTLLYTAAGAAGGAGFVAIVDDSNGSSP